MVLHETSSSICGANFSDRMYVLSQKILGYHALSFFGFRFECVLCFVLFLPVVMEDPLKAQLLVLAE